MKYIPGQPPPPPQGHLNDNTAAAVSNLLIRTVATSGSPPLSLFLAFLPTAAEKFRSFVVVSLFRLLAGRFDDLNLGKELG
ncbi:unnamed protein product [Caenorhabditis auriculariae]|uniref:Uncharacterized protein n=1 Tax=Caenorhabditis auriculariae TaxID=2777116 RepID=A0A8S1GW63_9PELO|nr:unnamed protein product [Caenorhabditis auriculariae]